MASDKIRQITDATVLAALAHPTRRRLMDALVVHGPSTAGQLSERLGVAVGNISHHLKVLAEADLLEEAPELARDRRERWWRRAHAGLRWTRSEVGSTAAEEAIADAAEATDFHRQIELTQAWFAGREPLTDLDRAAYSTIFWLQLNADELTEMSEEIVTVFRRWYEREVPDDGTERSPVFAFSRAFPARP